MAAYHLILRFFSPIGITLLLIAAGLALRRRKWAGLICLWGALSLVLICGNGYVAHGLARTLEWQNLPEGELPRADAIVILSGGILPRLSPRRTVEVEDAGDRVLYAAHLYHEGKAPLVICTGGIALGSARDASYADDTAEFLRMLGVPGKAIQGESKSQNTHENIVFLLPLLHEKKIKRILLVTSAKHMPRAFGAFRSSCPDMEVIAAPTDFGEVQTAPLPLREKLGQFVPAAGHFVLLDQVMHEYLGIVYYKLRGWM